MKSNSMIRHNLALVTVEMEVLVTWIKESTVYGDDADGNNGTRFDEYTAVKAELQTEVPRGTPCKEEIEKYLCNEALIQFEFDPLRYIDK